MTLTSPSAWLRSSDSQVVLLEERLNPSFCPLVLSGSQIAESLFYDLIELGVCLSLLGHFEELLLEASADLAALESVVLQNQFLLFLSHPLDLLRKLLLLF